MINRRKFLISSGVATAGLMFGTESFANIFYKNKVGLQLYSLRDEIPAAGLKKVLQNIAAAGYNSVEFYGFSATDGFFKNSPRQAAAFMRAAKLVAPSGHYDLRLFDKDGQKAIDAAKTLGHKYIVIPYLDESIRKTADDYKKVAERINKAAVLCSKSNIKLAYHNHDFEFKELDGGVRGYDLLLKECDSKLVSFELDLFWVVTAGQDPVKLFDQHPGRFKMWHVKDMDKADPKQQTEVGSGSIDFKKIFAAAKLSGLEYFYVEQENLPVPSQANIKKSSDYLKKHILADIK